MSIGRWFAPLAALALALFLGGCAARPGANIPQGRWKGSGVFFEHKAELAGDTAASMPAAANEHSGTGRYETTLSIKNTRAFGREALEFHILSRHGKMISLDDKETDLTFMLVRRDTRPDGVTEYAYFDGPPKSSEDTLPSDTVTAAVAFATAAGTVLQVQYLHQPPTPVFADTFRFVGKRVQKTGSVFEHAKGEDGKPDRITAVYWAEELKPSKK